MKTAADIYQQIEKERQIEKAVDVAEKWLEESGFDQPEFDGSLWSGIFWEARVTITGIHVNWDIKDNKGEWISGNDSGVNQDSYSLDDKDGVELLFAWVCRSAWLTESERPAQP